MAIKYHTTGSKPSKKQGKSFGGFWDNLVDEVHDTAAGFLPGIAEIGGAIKHDVVDTFDGGGTNYRSDDIARAIGRSYTDEGTAWGETGRKWAALLRGDIDAYKKHRSSAMNALYERPLGPILDAGAVVTLGAGAASRGAGLVAKAAPVGSRTRSIAASTAGLDPVTLGRLQRTITTADGDLSFTKTLSRNPTTRARQEAFEALSDRVDPNFPVIGHNRRVGRHLRRQFHRDELREAAQTLKPARRALAGMRGRERRAVTLLALGHDLLTYRRFIAKRMDDVKAEIRRKETTGNNEPGDNLEATLDPVPGMLPEPDQPLQIARTSEAAADPASKGDLVLHDGKARRTEGDEDLADDAPDEDDFSSLLERDRSDSLRTNYRNLAFLEKRYAELLDQRFGKLMANPTPKMQEALAALTELSETTTARLIREGLSPEKAAMRKTLESRILRAAGVDVPVYGGAIRSHISKHNEELDVSGGATATKVTKPSKLAELQRNTGYNFYNARDNLDPAMFLHSARQVFQYRARLDRFQKLLDGALVVSLEEARAYNPKAYKFLDADSRLRREANEIYGLLHDAEEILSGTPMYDDLMRTIERSVIDPRDRMRGPGAEEIDGHMLGAGDSPGSAPTVAVIPKSTYDEVLGEFIKSSEFVRRFFDKPTQVWRSLTLNLRPAWLVNNFVGQMFLLAFAHGAKGLKEYVLQFKRGNIVDELSPELVDFGWAHESLNDIAGLGSKSRVLRFSRRVSDFMGELNAKLTDSHTRKAAWRAEMAPHVKRLQKEYASGKRMPDEVTFGEIKHLMDDDVAGDIDGLLPDDTRLIPQTVRVDEIVGTQGPMRGRDFAEGETPDVAEYYEDLEKAVITGDAPRVILRRNGDGTFEAIDGNHRASLAQANQIDQIKAYVIREGDLSWDEAARILWRDERFADEITQRVLDDMIDFSDLSSFERTYIKRAIPFYSWIKGISKRGARLVVDEPWKAALMENTSDVGIEALEEEYGELPEFLRGMIPLTGGENPLVMTTQGLNPWMTPADVTGMVAGMALPGRHQGPQNPLAQFNPLIKAPAEALANRDFFYGTTIDRDDSKSFLTRLRMQAGNSLAQKRLIDEYLQEKRAREEGLEYDPLYEPSFRNAAASYMGLPIRNLDTRAARARAVAEAARQ